MLIHFFNMKLFANNCDVEVIDLLQVANKKLQNMPSLVSVFIKKLGHVVKNHVITFIY